MSNRQPKSPTYTHQSKDEVIEPDEVPCVYFVERRSDDRHSGCVMHHEVVECGACAYVSPSERDALAEAARVKVNGGLPQVAYVPVYGTYIDDKYEQLVVDRKSPIVRNE